MTTTISLSREQFASLASVGYAASTDDVTPVIQTVSLSSTHDGRIVALATDRYVIAEAAYTPYDVEGDELDNLLIHAPFLLKAAKSFPAKRGQSTPLKITVSDEDEDGLGREIEITDYDTKMTSREIKGNYPPVARLMPDELPKDVDRFAGWALNPSKIAQLAKVIPPTATARDIRDAAMTFQPVGNEEGRLHPILVKRPKYDDLRMLLQPTKITNY